MDLIVFQINNQCFKKSLNSNAVIYIMKQSHIHIYIVTSSDSFISNYILSVMLCTL